MSYLECSLLLIVAVHILHTALDLRQLKAIKMPEPPAALSGLFTTELFKSSQAYSIDKWYFGFLHAQFSLVEQCLSLWLGFLPWVWYKLPLLVPYPQLIGSEVGRTVCFMLLLSLMSLITSLPWTYYSTCESRCWVGGLPAAAATPCGSQRRCLAFIRQDALLCGQPQLAWVCHQLLCHPPPHPCRPPNPFVHATQSSFSSDMASTNRPRHFSSQTC
jgi:hypothetical protein